MRFAFILLAVFATAYVQAAEDAKGLLKSISGEVRSARGLHVEGNLVRQIGSESAGTKRQALSFAIWTQDPLHTRFEPLGSQAALQICDGEWFWTYPAGANSYAKKPATAEVCDPPVARWRDLTEHLVTATITGHDHSDFEGHPQDCEVVEAAYETPKPLMPGVPSEGRLIRTFCIDLTRRVILRESLEPSVGDGASSATHYSLEITYSRVEFDPPLGQGIFRFDPPPGSHEAIAAAVTTPPEIVQKHEPKYTREAIKANLEGSVILSLIVGTDGVPRDVKVLRGLGFGLDEEAVKAIETWRFKPATRGGEPVAVQSQIEVNFRPRSTDWFGGAAICSAPPACPVSCQSQKSFSEVRFGG